MFTFMGVCYPWYNADKYKNSFQNYTYIYTDIYVNTYVHTYMCVCVCVCVYKYIKALICSICKFPRCKYFYQV